MKQPIRFQDQHLNVTDFYQEVWVICPVCAKKAIAKTDYETKLARLFCAFCGHNKQASIGIGKNGMLKMEAQAFFDAELWLQAPFKNNEIFWAYNAAHLSYLEKYIKADLRETRNRTHFTMTEKLPKYMQHAKNRAALLKLINKLKQENGLL